MHNGEILLAPLRNQEAVGSSRMEGTVSTLDDVLRYEADQEESGNEPEGHYRNEAIEVFLYSRALSAAQRSIEQGGPLSSFLIKSAHKVLLGFGRGAHLSPGEFHALEMRHSCKPIKVRALRFSKRDMRL
ncbi:hypothetical protein N2599_20925 (plasmid) [Rhizobium sullae]|uniref:Fic/DOC N-terminal domain-containing protein n=2 Tax=Rhizobium sullae TaxID=50338 RepID=A0ABY5XWA7_RHISU|nr:Fic/DOC family N-terminal domain-containing protein [Rhizobium sullae]UWU18899.1 hypothetical protein N2599_20925 [Rhizobium sullae]